MPRDADFALLAGGDFHSVARGGDASVAQIHGSCINTVYLSVWLSQTRGLLENGHQQSLGVTDFPRFLLRRKTLIYSSSVAKLFFFPKMGVALQGEG